jgi:hypothetical protein
LGWELRTRKIWAFYDLEIPIYVEWKFRKRREFSIVPVYVSFVGIGTSTRRICERGGYFKISPEQLMKYKQKKNATASRSGLKLASPYSDDSWQSILSRVN